MEPAQSINHFKLLRLTALVVYASLCLSIAAGTTQGTRHYRARKQSHAVPAADRGVDTGTARHSAVLRAGPSANATVIGRLKAGALTVLVSRVALAGWLNVIQVSTGRQGWVEADQLTVHYTRHPQKKFNFQDQPTGTMDPPDLEISNSSDKTVFVHIQSFAEMAVPPHGSKSITVPAGIYQYNASAAEVIPDFGWGDFVDGTRYSWTFYITTATGSHNRTQVDPSLIAENKQLQLEIDRRLAYERNLKLKIDMDRSDLDQKQRQYDSDRAEVDSRRLSLDNTDQYAVDAFNQFVDQVNAEGDALDLARSAFNAEVDAYNADLAALDRARSRQQEIEASINRSG